MKKCALLYEQGYSLREIEERTGISTSTIRRSFKLHTMALRESGVTSSKRLNGHTIRRSGGYPHGWHLFDGRLVIDPKEQRVIRHIMQLYKQGTSKVDIAKYLNDKKIPTRSQGLWNESTIRSISARQKNLKQLEKCYE